MTKPRPTSGNLVGLEVTKGGTRHLEARMRGGRDLIIEGQDLGGKEGDDILELIADRCTGEDAQSLEEVIRNNNIPHEFWNHMGD